MKSRILFGTIALALLSAGLFIVAIAQAQNPASPPPPRGGSMTTGAYRYAGPITTPSIPHTDFLFANTSTAQDTYTVVDTGQTKCYNNTAEIACPSAGQAFYGQDAQFTRHAPSFTLSGDGLTVDDNNTGLTWQHSPDTNGDGSITAADKLNWTNAQAWPAALNAAHYGGYSDWRLPTIKELYSLIDFRGTDPSGYTGTDPSVLTPFIDRTYFDFAYGDTSAGERLIDSQYASNTMYVASSTKLFGVNFADGRIKGYDLTMPGGQQKTFLVQCVRGGSNYGVNSFVDNGDQTVTDSATGLMWPKADSAAGMTWEAALAWVQTRNAANYLGYNDWRLPNAKELQSIIDYTRAPATSGSAAINPVFSATAITNEANQTDWPYYWAATTHATYDGSGAAAVYLAFGRGVGWQREPPGATCFSLTDVHGAGAQRSDPKSGNLGNYYLGVSCYGGSAYGRGPQGDAIRISNYVRLVRTVSAPPPTSTPTATPTSAPTATPTPTACYDFDHNGQVDALDVTAVASRWQNPALYDPLYDVAAPIGEIDVVDVMTVAAQWGSSC